MFRGTNLRVGDGEVEEVQVEAVGAHGDGGG